MVEKWKEIDFGHSNTSQSDASGVPLAESFLDNFRFRPSISVNGNHPP